MNVHYCATICNSTNASCLPLFKCVVSGVRCGHLLLWLFKMYDKMFLQSYSSGNIWLEYEEKKLSQFPFSLCPLQSSAQQSRKTNWLSCK